MSNRLLLHDPVAHWLVIARPYRVLRHPSYTGLVLMAGGFGLTFGSWLGAAVGLVISAAGMLPRIWVEERALARAFGSDYTDYAGATSRLVPHVW